MATTTLGQISIACHGETRQLKTVSQAVHFLSLDAVKADVDMTSNGKVSQTCFLKGDKNLN